MTNRYSTADEAKAAITAAIEAGGAATGSEYDIDAIFAASYEYKTDTDEQGNQLLSTAGFEQVVDEAAFWGIVEENAKQ